MHRIKIIKIFSEKSYDDYDYVEIQTTFGLGLDWTEVDDTRFDEIAKLISYANRFRHELRVNYELMLIEEILPMDIDAHLEKAKELFLAYEEKARKMKEKEEKARAAKAEKAKATEMERKRKQFEKLQKELEGSQ
jgi:hypothetical protein